MILITPAQCRAARALLDWSQPDLAERCGMHVQTISAFESETGSPTKNTLQKISEVLEQSGVEFGPNNGVSMAESKFYQCENYNVALQDVLTTLKAGEEVLFLRADDRKNTAQEHDNISRLHEKGIKMRALTTTDNKIIRPDREYRLLPEPYFAATQLTLIYGDKVSLNVDYKDMNARFLVIKNMTLANAMKSQFEYWWKNGKDPVEKK